MHVAMWSGPRNLSTALMYAFAQRADCAVIDEPFYAAYLQSSGADHPMRAAVLEEGEIDPNAVVRDCLAPVPMHSYQKHMTHHMLPDFPLEWLAQVKNAFLIRHPARVIASYRAKRETVTLDDLGVVQQARIFDHVRSLGQRPVVIDSAAIRKDPNRALTALCDALGQPFDPAMLHWPKGGRAEDGIWAAHWYGAVHNSTGFAGPEGDLPDLYGTDLALAEAALPFYERLAALSL